jgi:NAD(P)-dependent dehydrogenase (short-subunit alcohol dehydrogenase family)
LLFILSRIKYSVPVGRYGEVEDIASAALYLASPSAGFITSTTIVVGM